MTANTQAAHYDAFVVRLWCDQTTGRVLRAEVEHTRTGTVSRGRGVPPTWVLDQITDGLGHRCSVPDGSSHPVEGIDAPT